MAAHFSSPPAFADEINALLSSQPEAIENPWPVWDRLREEAPVYRLGPVTLVARYDDVRALLRTPALSNHAQFVGTKPEAIMAGLDPEALEAHLEVSAFERKYVSRSDGAEHQRLRTIAHKAFTPRRVAQMQDQIAIYTSSLLDQMQAEDPADIMAGLAYTLPLMVITDMLEVPASDREQIHVWSNLLGRNRGGDDRDSLMRARTAMHEFRAYVTEVIADRRRHPGTDLVSALMAAEQGDLLSEEEITAMFVILLFAGHETTTNLIGHGIHQLCVHREQWDRLVADPSLATNATDELLRWVSPVQWIGRVAVAPVELGGHRIEPGETVFLLIAAANRDPRMFAGADLLDVGRAEAKNHLALGFGPHFCLGSALARLEGSVVFSMLATRFPRLELASDQVEYRGHAKLRGLVQLPLQLVPRSPVATSEH